MAEGKLFYGRFLKKMESFELVKMAKLGLLRKIYPRSTMPHRSASKHS